MIILYNGYKEAHPLGEMDFLGGIEFMSKVCKKCSQQFEVKTTSIQSGLGTLTVIIEGITIYVCPKCGDTILQSTDALVLQKFKETLDYERSEVTLKEKDEGPEILTLPEVAKMLRVSHQTIYNMIRDGRLKGYKVGREWRFLKKDMDDYLLRLQ